jgi:hypothetical protein
MFVSPILSKPFLWIANDNLLINGIELEFFPKVSEIESQPAIDSLGFSKGAPYVYRSLYASFGYVDSLTKKRWFLPKQELTTIGNLLIPPDNVNCNALNVWMRDGQSVKFTAELEDEEMRSLRNVLTNNFKQWVNVTDLYAFDAVAKTASCEILNDIPIGKYKLLVPNGTTGTMAITATCLTNAGTTLTSTGSANLTQTSTVVTLPVAENWAGKITFSLSMTAGNFPESFAIFTQDK